VRDSRTAGNSHCTGNCAEVLRGSDDVRSPAFRRTHEFHPPSPCRSVSDPSPGYRGRLSRPRPQTLHSGATARAALYKTST
jgi:hypothetical protein